MTEKQTLRVGVGGPVVPTAGAGEIVIRNQYMSLDPAIRGWMSDEPNYIEPIPVGTKIWATAIGEVVESRSPDFEVGDIALGIAAMAGWLLEGKLVHKEHLVDGLENALDAFHMLFDGRNTGKLIIRIADD